LAARLQAEHNLPYADCFAADLAEARKATLVTSDKDFERIGTVLKILFVTGSADTSLPRAPARNLRSQ
jgi:predicted nucleic acid-binding protein